MIRGFAAAAVAASAAAASSSSTGANNRTADRAALRRKLSDHDRHYRIERLYAGMREALIDQALHRGRELPSTARLGLRKGQRSEATGRQLLLEAFERAAGFPRRSRMKHAAMATL